MEIVVCLLVGYLLGCLHPAALLSKLKHIDLKKVGTKNLGASNALIVLGKGSGAFVMIFDILKAVMAAKIVKWLFPKLLIAGLLAGLGAIIGHVFPFYLHFDGGKGLAAFGGMVLAYKPALFALLLSLGVTLMLLVNYSFVVPMSAAILFPILVWLESGSVTEVLICACAGAIVIVKHWSNIGKALRGEDLKIRELIKNKLVVKSH